MPSFGRFKGGGLGSGGQQAPTQQPQPNFAPGVAMLNKFGNPSISTTYDARTLGMAFTIPFDYTAVQFLVPHMGGSGPMTGVKLVVAASDDIGSGNYAGGTSDANLRKFVVPHRGGVITNTLSADQGETGWLRVTRNGEAASMDVADAGAANGVSRWQTVLTDRMNLRGVRDVTYTSRCPLLVRFQSTGNVMTRTSYAGSNTNDQLKVDAGGVPDFLFATRSGDRVTDPSTWPITDTNLSYTNNPMPPLGVILFGAQRYSGVLFSMDSRGAISTQSATTAQYRSLEFYFENQARNNKYTVVKASRSGWTEEQYSLFAIAMMSGGRNTIRHVVHLIDSVNDGPVTQATIDSNKATALSIKAAADAINAETTFIVTYGRSTIIPADQLALLDELDTWARQQTRRVFNPLRVYAIPDGRFRVGVGFDGNHKFDATYADMASRLYDLLEFG